MVPKLGGYTLEYKLVSGDSHIDLSWLPGDLFVKEGPNKLRNMLPKVVESDDGLVWTAEGKTLGRPQAAGHGFGAPVRGMRRRVDRMFESGFYDGAPHPVDPELRMKDMQMDGVDGEILYGITGTGMRLRNHEIIAATYRIYNDWVTNFCSSNPGRWYALACVPIHDPVLAAQELTRAVDKGRIRGADLIASEVTHPIYVRDGYWDPLWHAVQELGAPISFHVGGGRIPVPVPPTTSNLESVGLEQNQLAYNGVVQSLGQFSSVQWLIGIILSGTCEKFPDFRFVMGESGAGWIPFALSRMDHIYKDATLDSKFEPPLSLMPSEYWQRQGYTTFQEESCVGEMATLIGEDNLMWGSDYPHPDGVWPDSRSIIAKTMGQLKPAILKKITCDNAVRLYGMGD
jgi:predicted TIM-barrel fold metal-dependent hydrolase